MTTAKTYITDKDIETLKQKGMVEFKEKGVRIVLKYLEMKEKA